MTVVQSIEIKKVRDRVLATALSIEMSEAFLFVLCSTQKLKIFDLKAFDLVIEIDTKANQMKLVSTEFFALYDSAWRILHLHSQDGFALVEKINLIGTIETGLKLARDKTRFITFYNEKKMKFLDINQSINF